ncbi:transposase domain-containing protein [Paraburkholderia sp. IMGN_8]|uniref:transposase domain-containing protein n=1 Tax=Paraburkholderia sp. IMGN_8 TaxID=3136564 RepID=UPI00310142B1
MSVITRWSSQQKASGIDPSRYLTWLFRRIPLAQTVDGYAALRPWSMLFELR